jgi:hypothetical protein
VAEETEEDVCHLDVVELAQKTVAALCDASD